MKGFRGGILLAMAAPFFLAGKGESATVTTVSRLSLSAGQDFFDGTAGSIAGNADAIVTPVIQFSDRWSLFPTYHGFYQGNQEVRSLAGGGTLFRDSTGHSLLLKSVHTLGAWKIKPSAGVGGHWLRETRDEDWGQGLFDNQKWNAGLEAEYAPSRAWGARAAYDYYRIRFPHYQSLESAQDSTLSRELEGEYVLNNANHMGTLGYWVPLPGGVRWRANAMFNHRGYKDQPIIDDMDQPTAQDRSDRTFSIDNVWGRGFQWPWTARWTAELGGRYESLNSNQNHYDAKKTAFQPNYYDYSEWAVSPSVTVYSGDEKWKSMVSGSYERRDYGHRLAQDAEGNNRADKLTVQTTIARWSLARAIAPHTEVKLEGSLGWSHANTDYSQVFRYNYRMASYGLGVVYEY